MLQISSYEAVEVGDELFIIHNEQINKQDVKNKALRYQQHEGQLLVSNNNGFVVSYGKFPFQKLRNKATVFIAEISENGDISEGFRIEPE